MHHIQKKILKKYLEYKNMAGRNTCKITPETALEHAKFVRM
jgi:alpha-galactosidase/6-phospho-beta-glucosidase family protein